MKKTYFTYDRQMDRVIYLNDVQQKNQKQAFYSKRMKRKAEPFRTSETLQPNRCRFYAAAD